VSTAAAVTKSPETGSSYKEPSRLAASDDFGLVTSISTDSIEGKFMWFVVKRPTVC